MFLASFRSPASPASWAGRRLRQSRTGCRPCADRTRGPALRRPSDRPAGRPHGAGKTKSPARDTRLSGASPPWVLGLAALNKRNVLASPIVPKSKVRLGPSATPDATASGELLLPESLPDRARSELPHLGTGMFGPHFRCCRITSLPLGRVVGAATQRHVIGGIGSIRHPEYGRYRGPMSSRPNVTPPP